MKDKKWVSRTKLVGDILIYAGTASIARPLIRNGNEDRSMPMKVCATAAGTAISCAVAGKAARGFERLVDAIDKFIGEMKPSKEEKADG